MSNAEKLQKTLEAAFSDSLVRVEDMTGTQDHFEVRIESDSFRNKSLVEQHRMVYAAVGHMINREVHALKISTSERKNP